MTSFIIWHPTLGNERGRRDQVGMTLTPVDTEGAPLGPAALVAQLLRDIGVTRNPVSWQVETYRSSYNNKRELSDDWSDLWILLWRMVIDLDRELDAEPAWPAERYGTVASPDPREFPIDVYDEMAVGCLVIADFRTRAEADVAVRLTLTDPEAVKIRTALSAPEPRHRYVDIGQQLVQVQIDLGRFEPQFFIGGATYAQVIESLCERAGGITYFDDRAAEWGELR